MEGREPDEPSAAGAAGTAEGGRAGFIAESVRKALLAGVGALFLTEEGARRLAREWKLPKEVIGYIGQQAQGAKEELLRVFADEFRRFLESESVRKEFWAALADNAIEIHAEIRLRPDAGGAPRPVVSGSVRPKRAKRRRAR
jgi:hypothetical protein